MFSSLMLSQTNTLLSRATIGSKPPVFLFLTGSSGCGKTFLAQALRRCLNSEKAAIFFFDDVGVPSDDVMKATHGSGEKWQEATTHSWVQKLAAIQDKALVVLEGQYNPNFALSAITQHGIKDWRLVVVTANQEVWEERLRGPRDQAKLINEDMRNWARFLREETVRLGGDVIDTSASDIGRSLEDLAALIHPLLMERESR